MHQLTDPRYFNTEHNTDKTSTLLAKFLHALSEQVGKAILFDAAQTMYKTNGKILQSGQTPETSPPSFLAIYRDEIGVHLRNEAQRLCSDAIKYHFDCPVKGIDFDQQTVSVPDSRRPKVNSTLSCIYTHLPLPTAVGCCCRCRSLCTMFLLAIIDVATQVLFKACTAVDAVVCHASNAAFRSEQYVLNILSSVLSVYALAPAAKLFPYMLLSVAALSQHVAW